MRTAPTPTSSPRASPGPEDAPGGKPNGDGDASGSQELPTTKVADSDNMDIDEDPELKSGPSHKYTVVSESQQSTDTHVEGDNEWSSDDWMADMRRVKVCEPSIYARASVDYGICRSTSLWVVMAVRGLGRTVALALSLGHILRSLEPQPLLQKAK